MDIATKIEQLIPTFSSDTLVQVTVGQSPLANGCTYLDDVYEEDGSLMTDEERADEIREEFGSQLAERALIQLVNCLENNTFLEKYEELGATMKLPLSHCEDEDDNKYFEVVSMGYSHRGAFAWHINDGGNFKAARVGNRSELVEAYRTALLAS